MRKKILSIAIVAPLLALGIASATQEHTPVNICHATSSESHPWEAIQIDDDAYQTHLGHGDFDYAGPVKDNGKPTKDGNEWCEQNGPKEETPPVTETPKVDTPVTPTSAETPRASEPVVIPEGFSGK